MAFLGEFQRVSDQVEDDLLEKDGIRLQRLDAGGNLAPPLCLSLVAQKHDRIY